MRLLHSLVVLAYASALPSFWPTDSFQDAIRSQIQAGFERSVSQVLPMLAHNVQHVGHGITRLNEVVRGTPLNDEPNDFINWEQSTSFQTFSKMMNTAVQPDVMNLLLDALTDRTGL
jgi:hypothetical protein